MGNYTDKPGPTKECIFTCVNLYMLFNSTIYFSFCYLQSSFECVINLSQKKFNLDKVIFGTFFVDLFIVLLLLFMFWFLFVSSMFLQFSSKVDFLVL